MSDLAPDFRLEWATDRESLAAVFRALATALERNEPVQVRDEDATVTLEVPSQVVASLEVDAGSGEAGAADDVPPESAGEEAVSALAVDLQWDDDGSSVRIAPGEEDEVDAPTSTDGVTVIDPRDDPVAPTETPNEASSAAAPTEAVVPKHKRRSDGTTAPDRPDPSEGSRESRRSRFEVYEDRAGKWRWRLVHWNGHIVADGGQGYASKRNVKRAVRGVMRTASTARLVERERN